MIMQRSRKADPSSPGQLSPDHLQPGHLPIVGVMGSGAHPHARRAGMVGRWLAGEGVHLLTGGGQGVMSAVSEAFFKVPHRQGAVIGILPGAAIGRKSEPLKPPSGYPNPWVEIPILTHLPLSGSAGTDHQSRNHINILTSEVIIALPGSAGTSSEVTLALRYNRPLVAFLDSRDEIPDLPENVRVTDDFEQIKKWVRSVLNT